MNTRDRYVGLAVVILALAGCSGADVSPAASGGDDMLEGAWRVSEFRLATGTTVSGPASMYLFTSQHYSIMYANRDAPRATFADVASPTAAETAEAFNTFIANSGSYSLIGDTLVIRPVISKHPGFMGGGEDRFMTRVAGDTLWLTGIVGAFRWASGQPATPSGGGADSFTLVRAR